MIDDIQTNAASFEKALLALGDHVEGSVSKVIRKACFDLYKQIIQRTPFETGRARMGWSIGSEFKDVAPPEAVYSKSDITSMISENSKEFSTEEIGGFVYLYNNIEYIEYLENGHSIKQAPQGMVAVSIAAFTTHFNNALQGLEGMEPA